MENEEEHAFRLNESRAKWGIIIPSLLQVHLVFTEKSKGERLRVSHSLSLSLSFARGTKMKNDFDIKSTKKRWSREKLQKWLKTQWNLFSFLFPLEVERSSQSITRTTVWVHSSCLLFPTEERKAWQRSRTSGVSFSAKCRVNQRLSFDIFFKNVDLSFNRKRIWHTSLTW
jgi:hypothetical protein